MEEYYVVKKLLRAMHANFLQIASTIEQFGDIDAMTMDEVVGKLKAHEERMWGQLDNTGGQLLLTQEEWSKRTNKTGGSNHGGQRGQIPNGFRGRGRGAARGGNSKDGTKVVVKKRAGGTCQTEKTET